MPWFWITLLTPLIFFIVVDLFAGIRARKFRLSELEDEWNEDFSVLVPIYGDMKYLSDPGSFAAYADKVVLCTSSGETDEFYQEFRSIATQYGFRTYLSPYVPPQSTGGRRTSGVIRDCVIRDALNNVAGLGVYTICIDADTASLDRLEKLVGAFEVSAADFASVNLVPQEDGGMLVQLQRHEYRQAMRARFLLPWLLSGACHIGKTEVLRVIMSRHSLFFQGNDVETGLLGDQLGYVSTHLPFELRTDVPTKFKGWWRQRIAWSGGEFRLFITNIRYIVKHPYLWIYSGFIAIAMVSLRWWAIAQPSWILVAVAAAYYAGVIWIHWHHRNRWLLVMPIYALFNSLVIVPIGIVWYFVMAIPEKNFGVIRPNREVEVSV